MQLIRALHEIFAEAQLPLWLRPYEVGGWGVRHAPRHQGSRRQSCLPAVLLFSSVHAAAAASSGRAGWPHQGVDEELLAGLLVGLPAPSSCWRDTSVGSLTGPRCSLAGAAHQQPDCPDRDGSECALHPCAQVQVCARHQVRPPCSFPLPISVPRRFWMCMRNSLALQYCCMPHWLDAHPPCPPCRS